MRILARSLPDRPHANDGQVLDLPDDEAKEMLRLGTGVLPPEEPVLSASEPSGINAETAEPDPIAEQPESEAVPGKVRRRTATAQPASRGKRR